MERDWHRRAVVEVIGTFALIFVGAGAIIETGGKDLVAIALAHGLAIGVMVAAVGHISGGVYNPALVCGLVAARRFTVSRGAYYIVSQLIGALLAALALKVIFPAILTTPVGLGTPQMSPGYSPGVGVLIEIIMTFFLMYAVFGVAVDMRGARAIAGLVIGLSVTIDIFVGGGVSGAAMNPARWFGPALVQGIFTDWYVWWIGPIVGAIGAALLWNEVYLRDVPTPEPGASSVDVDQSAPAASPAQAR